MKYFNKTMAAAIIAGAMSLTSCVDNEVSPEVKEMREVQMAYLQAKADLEAARAEQQRIKNDYDEANYALMLQSREASLALEIARVDQWVAEAIEDMKAAEIRVEKAIAAYEKYLAEQGLKDAEGYLESYKNAVATLNDLAEDRLSTKADIAIEEAVLASVNAPWEIQAEIQATKLARANSKLAAQEAALASLETVASEPEAYEEEASELNARITELTSLNEKLKVDEKKAKDAKAAAQALYTQDVKDLIAEYEALEEEYEAEEDETRKAELKAELDEKKADYEAAVAIEADFEAKSEVLAEIQTEIAANSTMKTSLQGVITVINTYINYIDKAIADQLAAIEKTKKEVLAIEKTIAEGTLDKEAQEVKIAKLKAELATLEAEISAQETIVARYKALLDAAVGN